MSRKPSAAEALFVHAIVTASDPELVGALGLGGREVRSVTCGRIRALVSDAPQGLRPERRHLAAHHALLKRLGAQSSAVLPVSFGVVADGIRDLRRVLAENEQTLLEQLRRVAGRVEMLLRITWDVPNIFEHFVETHPDLRAARDRLLQRAREPTRDERIDVGCLFDRTLAEDREAHTARVEEVLAPRCAEIARNEPRHTKEVANLACLVDRDRQAEFEAAVLDAAKQFDNNYAFDYSGPWAPHDFVDLALDLEPAGRQGGPSETGGGGIEGAGRPC